MRAYTLLPALLFLFAGAGHAEMIPVAGFDVAAIHAAVARSAPGDTVSLPAGEYAITETIRLRSGTRLIGAGIDKTILRFAAEKPGAILDLSRCEEMEVAHLTLDGGGNPNARRGIGASNARHLKLHHLAIRNLGPGGGPMGISFSGHNPSRARGVTDSEISDCILENIGVGDRWGAAIRVSWGSSRNRILRNTIRDTGRGGIFGNDGCDDLVIQGNTVTGSGGEGLGIEVWGGCNRALIEDNRIDHWLSFSGANYGAARRNIISDKSGRFKGFGIELVDANYCVFTDNVVDGGSSIGLSASNKPPKNYAFWGNNTFRGCNLWGAQLQGDAGGVGYQYLYRCRFLETTVGVGNPRYPGHEGNGFRTNGNAHHLTLEECEIAGNGRYGLQLGGGGVDFLSFVRCTIRGNKGAAVVGPSGYTTLEWVECQVEGNKSDRIPEARPFPHPAPTARFEAPDRARVGEPVTFASTATAANGEIKQVLWDFGDGLPATEARATHTYTKPGEYRVTLIVWDEGGRGARAEQIIRVR